MLAFVALLCLLGLPAQAETIRHGGIDRHYERHIPDSFQAPGPVVFVLHGGTRSAAQIRRSTQFHELGEAEGFATIYPDGVGHHWNDARFSSANPQVEDIDDVGFLVALARKLAADGVADPKRIYVTGSSNGGMMSYRLACEAANIFAAFAPIIANLPAGAEQSCRPARPVPVIAINGTDDKLILWQGGPVAPMFPPARGNTLSTQQTISIFARRIGHCVEAGSEEGLLLRDGSNIMPIRHHFSDCKGGVEVVLYEMQRMGHRWPQSRVVHLPGRWGDLLGPAPTPDGFPANRIIWRFLKRFHLP